MTTFRILTTTNILVHIIYVVPTGHTCKHRCGFITIIVPFMAVPGFDSKVVEKIPEYVRDMMQNKEDKLQAISKVAVLSQNKDHNRFTNT